MIAEIITIGDEILIGQIVDTNSAWMGVQLNMAGIKVKQITSVSDEKQHILDALKDAEKRADLVLITGGLGPTKDDITKHTLAVYFNTTLQTDETALAMVTDFFAKRGRDLTELNRKQAEVLSNCITIHNYNGTAPGMWIKHNNTIFVSMPGVPFEMKAMISDFVIPKLKKEFDLPAIYHKTILTNGIGESYLAERIEKWEDTLASKNIKLAYLPSPAIVKLRLSTSGKDETKLKQTVEEAILEVEPLIQEFIFGYEEYGKEPDQIEHIIASLLKERKLKLALAESCTGGYISHLITSISGCSEFYQGGIIPYHNEFKNSFLEVDTNIFKEFGAVSETCVKSMAENVRKKFVADISVAVSGIAGPLGGTDEKPVGTVWIAVSYKETTLTKKFQFGTDRNRNIRMAAITALNMLRKSVLEVQ
ncbi:MAG TPA: competence/damage-inducible protein A [Bacteroidia bacterium]